MKTLTEQQFNELLSEPLLLNFEMEASDDEQGVYSCSYRDYHLIEGEFNVYANISLEYRQHKKAFGGREWCFISDIEVNDGCDRYELTDEQYRAFEKHFENSFSIEGLAEEAMPREYIWDYNY